MALTAMPGWTATDMFARPPRAVVRHAPAGGVMMHAACTFMPGWTWTTVLGGPGTVGGRLTDASAQKICNCPAIRTGTVGLSVILTYMMYVPMPSVTDRKSTRL